MMDLTFLIPSKLESEDRIRNLTTVLSFIFSNFDAKVIVKEVDSDPKIDKFVIPLLKQKFGEVPNN